MKVARAEGLSLMRQIVIEKGTISDYREMAHLHYVPGDPAVVAGVWRAVWRGHNCELKIELKMMPRIGSPCQALQFSIANCQL